MKKTSKKLQLKTWQNVLAIILIAGVILLLEMVLMPGSIFETLRGFWSQKALFLLNYFPIAAVIALLYLITGNACTAGAVTTALFGALSYANLLKIEGRNDALTPSDVGLIKEALNAAGEYQLDLHWDKVAMFVVVIAILAFAACKTRGLKKSWGRRLICAAATALIFCGCVHFIYTDNTLYYSFDTPVRYNVPLEYNTLGVNYCFFHNWNSSPVVKPDGFKKSEVAAWEEEVEHNSPELKPNIIFVMCEAFSDLADEPMFLYGEDDNPLRDFHTLCGREHALSGRIVVSNYAAGTANTEFNVLSGMQANAIGKGLTSAFRVVHSDTKNMATVLEADGYNSFFMHPGQDWFYNRASVYRYFGIRDQVFSEAFTADDYKGNQISDEAFFTELKRDLKTRLIENDAPLFTYAVTIQNHQTYGAGKYSFTPADVPLSVSVSDKSMEYLRVYMEGVRDSSALVLELADYVDSLDEPTILAFFGDHRPNMGDAYTELGLNYNLNDTPESTIASYTVPFVLYTNTACGDYYDYDTLGLSSPESGAAAGKPLISDNYLGAMVLELVGYGENDALFSRLNALRRTVPVYRQNESAYLLQDGRFVDELNAEGNDSIECLRKFTYYRLKF